MAAIRRVGVDIRLRRTVTGNFCTVGEHLTAVYVGINLESNRHRNRGARCQAGDGCFQAQDIALHRLPVIIRQRHMIERIVIVKLNICTGNIPLVDHIKVVSHVLPSLKGPSGHYCFSQRQIVVLYDCNQGVILIILCTDTIIRCGVVVRQL